MGTYKVIQDVEAEDKILGPLTLKQFLFAGIAAAILFIGWMIGRQTSLWIILLFLIPATPFLFLAAPLGRDQPNDVWLAARLRFFFKPRIRKWDQTGQQEYVTITAPKREVHVYSDGLSRGEVQSRLKTLAATIDSRGWAVKNVSLDLTSPSAQNDRLIHPTELPQEVNEIDIKPWDDMLDGNSTQVGQHFQQLMDQQTQDNRQALEAKMQQARQAASNQPQAQAGTSPSVSATANTPLTVADEQAFLENLHERQERLGIRRHSDHEKVIEPLGSEDSRSRQIAGHKKRERKPTTRRSDEQQIAVADFGSKSEVAADASTPEQNPEPPHADTAIINELSQESNLKVSTLSSLAKHAEEESGSFHDNEVVELH